MNQKHPSLFQRFLTSDAGALDPRTLRRIKVLNVFELVFVIFAPFLGFFYFYIGAITLFYVCILSGLLGIFLLFLLRLTKSPRLIGNLSVLVLWGTLVAILWKTGGVGADDLILLSWVWNAVLILLAIFMTGYFWGTIWACMVFVETAFAVHLFRSGHHLVNLIPTSVATIYSLGAYLLGLLVVLLFAFLFEKESNEALAREEEKARILRDSKKYVEDILLRSPIPTFVVDRQHRVVQWNKACQQLTGITSEAILGKQVCEGISLNHGGSLADRLLDDPDSIREQYGESIVSWSDSGSFSIEMTLPHLCGGLRAVLNAAPILDADGRVKGAIQTIQPAENAFGNRASKPDPADLNIDETCPVYRIDRNGKITGWNGACESLLGYSAAQMVGKNPLSVLSKPYRANFRETIVRALQGQTIDGKEWKYYNTDGEPVYVLARIVPIPGASGETQECMVIHADVTDLKLRVKKLERYAIDSKDKYKKLAGEYQLLRRNIATFIRKKEE